jgi:hypothetical protein
MPYIFRQSSAACWSWPCGCGHPRPPVSYLAEFLPTISAYAGSGNASLDLKIYDSPSTGAKGEMESCVTVHKHACSSCFIFWTIHSYTMHRSAPLSSCVHRTGSGFSPRAVNVADHYSLNISTDHTCDMMPKYFFFFWIDAQILNAAENYSQVHLTLRSLSQLMPSWIEENMHAGSLSRGRFDICAGRNSICILYPQ